MELSNEFEVAVPVEQAWAVLTDIERIAPCLPGAQLQEIDGDDFKGVVKVKVGPITAQYKGAATFVEKDDAAHKAVLNATGRDTRGQGNASATIVAELEPRGDGATHVSVLTDLAVTGKVAQFGRGVMADVSAKLLDQFVQNLETTVLADLAATDAAAGDTDAPAAAAASAAETLTAPTTTAAPAAPGEVAKKAKDTTEMLASELAKAWEEAKEGTEDADETKRVEREPLAPRPDLLVPDAEPEAAPEPAAAAPAAPAEPTRRVIDSPEAEPIDLLGTAGSPVLQRAAPLIGLAAAVLIILALLRRRRRRS
jgi:carbon monoxide dehydrogenase subunit G